jgi:hypothetical protein
MVGKIGRAGFSSKDNQATVAGNKLKQSWFHAASLFFSLFIISIWLWASLTALHSVVVTIGSGIECIAASASFGFVRRDCVKRILHTSENNSLYQLSAISQELNGFRFSNESLKWPLNY